MRGISRLYAGRVGRARRGLIAVSRTCQLHSTDTVDVSYMIGVIVGHVVTGDHIPANTTVLSIDTVAKTATLSHAATATVADVVLTFSPP